MNKIEKLLDENFVKKYFEEKLLPLYQGFKKIEEIEILPHKKMIWPESYHVVFEFRTKFSDKKGEEVVLPIFCSGHSHEKRENVFSSLKFLWDKGFSKGDLSIPKPLFFDKEFNATFYRGVLGKNLYKYIKEKDFENIEKIIAKSAKWFAKLHNLEVDDSISPDIINSVNGRIETVVPGKAHVINSIKEKHPEFLDIYKKSYDYFIEQENSFLNKIEKRWFIHGDAHPENIIKMGKKKIAVIDFTDLSLSDFARDIGCFLQQVEYMSNKKIEDPKYSEKLQKIFLDNYFKRAKIDLDLGLKQRISNYYYWTSIRTASYLLIGTYYNPERGKMLLEDIDKGLGGLIPVLK
ncbi:aminoglycoside phosphotransferase family protein [bacterium]|nr:aminoglycoside phosphotransferase family protein [bacterium]